MIFEVPLICWDYSDISLLMMGHPNYLATVLLSSSLTGSNDAFYIHQRAPEIYTKTRMCVIGNFFCIVRYMDVAEANNYSRLTLKHRGIMVGRASTMRGLFNCSPQCYICMYRTTVLLSVQWRWCFFIGSTFDVTHLRNLIQIWRYCIYQDRICCGIRHRLKIGRASYC